MRALFYDKSAPKFGRHQNNLHKISPIQTDHLDTTTMSKTIDTTTQVDDIAIAGSRTTSSAKGADESKNLQQQKVPNTNAQSCWSALEKFGISCMKDQLIKWFYSQSIHVLVDTDKFFGPDLFDCFYADVQNEAIAFRFKEGVDRSKFLTDDYEHIVGGDDLKTPTQIAVYLGVPFQKQIHFPERVHVMECVRRCEEVEFTSIFSDAIDLANLPRSATPAAPSIEVDTADYGCI